jgi:multiple sugar transport system ATP-binding protein
MAPVRLARIGKTFGAVQALRDVSLDIADGQLMVLLGPSGCGKTTLLRSVAGLETVDTGDIFIAGRRINDVPAHRRNVAMVFQSYALYPNLTVFENIAFPLRARRMAAAEVASRVQAAAERVGVQEMLARRPGQLSGGQRQRIAIARAIVREPEVFLLDEPLSNLDAQLRAHTRAEITRLQKRLGTTTVLVTHDQVEAMTMGDRITVMNQGRILQTGSPVDIYLRPANTFVAGFVGSPPMNLAPAEVASRAGRAALALGGQGEGWIDLPGGSAAGLAAGEALTVGVRPEDLTLVPGGAGFVRGRVDLVEYLGSDTHLTVVGGGLEWLVKLSGSPRVALQDQVELASSPERVYLFRGGDGGELIGTLAEVGSAAHAAG